jgi:hypothetical protein
MVNGVEGSRNFIAHSHSVSYSLLAEILGVKQRRKKRKKEG